MTESILKSIASILVDAMYHVADIKKWEACKAQIIQNDNAVKDLNIRAALLTIYIAIERDILSLEENANAVQISEDILSLIGDFSDKEAESLFSGYIDKEIADRKK